MARSLILTGVFIVIFFLLPMIGLGHLIHPKKWEILAFFAATSLLSSRLSELGLRNKGENFVTFSLATNVLRIILSLFFIGIYLFLKVEQSLLFILNFFVLYLCYTVFEIWNNSRKLRQNS
jgi:O-antigen/teichoic acid export membrane protein